MNQVSAMMASTPAVLDSQPASENRLLFSRCVWGGSLSAMAAVAGLAIYCFGVSFDAALFFVLPTIFLTSQAVGLLCALALYPLALVLLRPTHVRRSTSFVIVIGVSVSAFSGVLWLYAFLPGVAASAAAMLAARFLFARD